MAPRWGHHGRPFYGRRADGCAGQDRSVAADLARCLAARRISSRSIAAYTTSVEHLDAFLAAHGMPAKVAAIRHEHVEAFVADLLTTRAPATAHNRYPGCQAIFARSTEEGEVKASPMERTKPPQLQDAPPPVLRERDPRAILPRSWDGDQRVQLGRRRPGAAGRVCRADERVPGDLRNNLNRTFEPGISGEAILSGVTDSLGTSGYIPGDEVVENGLDGRATIIAVVTPTSGGPGSEALVSIEWTCDPTTKTYP